MAVGRRELEDANILCDHLIESAAIFYPERVTGFVDHLADEPTKTGIGGIADADIEPDQLPLQECGGCGSRLGDYITAAGNPISSSSFFTFAR